MAGNDTAVNRDLESPDVKAGYNDNSLDQSNSIKTFLTETDDGSGNSISLSPWEHWLESPKSPVNIWGSDMTTLKCDGLKQASEDSNSSNGDKSPVREQKIDMTTLFGDRLKQASDDFNSTCSDMDKSPASKQDSDSCTDALSNDLSDQNQPVLDTNDSNPSDNNQTPVTDVRRDVHALSGDALLRMSTDSKPSDKFDVKNSMSVCTPGTRVSHIDSWNIHCDACQMKFPPPDGIYCRSCLQSLCVTCAHVHGNLSTSSDHLAEQIGLLHHKVTLQTTKALLTMHDSLIDACRYLERFTGLQVSLNVKRAEIAIATMDEEILEVAMETVELIGEPQQNRGIKKTLHNGGVEWSFLGETGEVVKHLFKNNLVAMIGTFDYVSISYTSNGKSTLMREDGMFVAGDLNISDTHERLSCTSVHQTFEDESGTAINAVTINELVIRTTELEEYIALRDIIEDLVAEINDMFKAEVTRPAKDELKMRLYMLTKESNKKVACTMVALGSARKLVIRGWDKSLVQDTKEEFCNIFCKECTVCMTETTRPMYLDCKHLLCLGCVHHSANLNNGMKCPICSLPRQVTPVRSLQAHCVDLLEEFYRGGQETELTSAISASQSNHKTRTKSTHHRAIKVPKYLLKRWKKQSGGIKRLKSLIMNEYGLQVAGSEDCLKIYGEKLDILELAVQTIEHLHDSHVNTGLSCRIVDKNVEWRFRDNWAKIVHYLFHKEMTKLKKRKTVTVRVFPDKYPTVVEIRCAYKEYEHVRYEVDEIDNGCRKMFKDEAIQPRTFYFNKKVAEFLDSKKTDCNIFCELINRKNLNVIIFRARQKVFIYAAKEELSKW